MGSCFQNQAQHCSQHIEEHIEKEAKKVFRSMRYFEDVINRDNKSLSDIEYIVTVSVKQIRVKTGEIRSVVIRKEQFKSAPEYGFAESFINWIFYDVCHFDSDKFYHKIDSIHVDAITDKFPECKISKYDSEFMTIAKEYNNDVAYTDKKRALRLLADMTSDNFSFHSIRDPEKPLTVHDICTRIYS